MGNIYDNIIQVLLETRANNEAEKQREIDEAVARISESYDERSNRIERMLSECGYEEPEEQEEEITEEDGETADDTECSAEDVGSETDDVVSENCVEDGVYSV